MAALPRRTERCKVLRLACWNADAVRGRELELEHFLSNHGVDICLVSETFLNPGQALALYADDTAITATSRKPTLLVSCLELYLNDLQRWSSEWRIAINVSKSTTIIFARAGRRFIQTPPVTLSGKPIEWVEITLYLGVAVDTRLTWSPHIDQVR